MLLRISQPDAFYLAHCNLVLCSVVKFGCSRGLVSRHLLGVLQPSVVLQENGDAGCPPRKVFNPGSHMERSHSLEFQTVRAAPFKKLPARPDVSSASVPVADRGGEEVNVGFSDFGAGSGNQIRDPRARRRAGNDRKFSSCALRFCLCRD
jgi:hypothetical protein